MKVVVVGNGMAGHRFCQVLSECGPRGLELTVFGEERRPAYDRVHLSEYLSRPDPDRLLLAPPSWYAQRGIELRTGERVAEVDRRHRVVRTASGAETAYDRLVLATGSLPFEPPIPGIHVPGVYVYRTLDDLHAIRQRAAAARRALVLGGGLLGLEAAQGLQRLGLEVRVVEAAPHLMPRQLDAESAALLQRLVRATGLRLTTGVQLRAIHARPRALEVVFADAPPEQVDLLVVAAGIRPRDALGRTAALEIGPTGGIVVNDRMQTRDERILAIGECASHDGVVYGLVKPCYEMARVAAEHIAGKSTRFRPPDGACRLDLASVEAVVVGRYDPKRPGISHTHAERRRTLCFDGERLVGACGIGPWPDLWRLERLIEQGGKLSQRQRQRFQRTGSPWPANSSLPVARWPASAPVCSCRNVTRGSLAAAMSAGQCTVAALCQATGAGSVCGSCRPLLAELCQQPPEAGGSRTRASLGLPALLALAGAIAVAMIPPSGWRLAEATGWRLLEDARVSGFAILATCAVALLLSIRKRVRLFALGDFGHWRVVHAAVGLLALGLVAAHTGLSLGQNFNRVLSLVFLGVVASGGVLGVCAALGAGGRGWVARLARRCKRPLAALHWLVLWPLPALIGIHILVAYYF